MGKSYGFEPVGNRYNQILEGPDFYVSFNPGKDEVAPLLGVPRGGETALVKGSNFWILNGDFRKEYAELVPQGWGKCIKFFNEKEAQHRSGWSSP